MPEYTIPIGRINYYSYLIVIPSWNDNKTDSNILNPTKIILWFTEQLSRYLSISFCSFFYNTKTENKNTAKESHPFPIRTRDSRLL